MSRQATRVEESPIFMTRLVADTGGIMTGGAAQVGSVGITVAIRSCDQLPGLKQVGARLEDAARSTTAGEPTWSADARAPRRR